MRRFLSLLLPLLWLAACDGDGGPTPLPTEQIAAAFPPHGITDVIVIDATDRLPLRSAVLIAPDGRTTPADGIEVNDRPHYAAGLSASANPTRTGLGELSVPSPLSGPAIHSEGELLIALSKASITLADPVSYRRDWQRYRIRLDFGTPPGAVETREIAAPEPPAS
jgi:hypothetical protein